jgi:hypothetical protein
VLVYFASAHVMAAGYGERVLWARRNHAGRAVKATPRRPLARRDWDCGARGLTDGAQEQ